MYVKISKKIDQAENAASGTEQETNDEICDQNNILQKIEKDEQKKGFELSKFTIKLAQVRDEWEQYKLDHLAQEREKQRELQQSQKKKRQS